MARHQLFLADPRLRKKGLGCNKENGVMEK